MSTIGRVAQLVSTYTLHNVIYDLIDTSKVQTTLNT